ncbi:TetR/AcrR family transcriptional regulator [Tomitella biformata]|uniref:TetR/AcrR family transcriptional regulator n=1 Tax=Tomitella biformata TaxID=630403 RepID=UPI000463CE42|nr:TetR/AcrR family transcriptional regulator [Tomitella biformata]
MPQQAESALDRRRRVRRADFIVAGIALLGAADGGAVTVRGACRVAGLTERYFYESFEDRDQYVRQVYEEVGARAHQALSDAMVAGDRGQGGAQAERAAAAVDAFVGLMVDQPAMGRVLLLAPIAEPALSGIGMALLPAFITLVLEQLTAVPDPVEKQLLATGVVGALTALFVGYLEGTLVVDRARLVEHCVELVLDTNRRR